MRMRGLHQDSKAINSPAVREEERGGDEKLGAAEARRFRGMAARLNYLGQDRSDIQYATKEICTGMANPTMGGGSGR